MSIRDYRNVGTWMTDYQWFFFSCGIRCCHSYWANRLFSVPHTELTDGLNSISQHSNVVMELRRRTYTFEGVDCMSLEHHVSDWQLPVTGESAHQPYWKIPEYAGNTLSITDFSFDTCSFVAQIGVKVAPSSNQFKININNNNFKWPQRLRWISSVICSDCWFRLTS